QQGNAFVAGLQQQFARQAIGHPALMQEQVEAAVLQGVRVMPEIAGHRPVGAEVDHHDALAAIGQQAREGDGCAGLADSTRLVGSCPASHLLHRPGAAAAPRLLAGPGWAGDGELTAPVTGACAGAAGAGGVPALFNAASGFAWALPTPLTLRRTSRLREITS